MNPIRDVVVVAASSGGLTAIGKLAANWPKALRVPILIAYDAGGQPPGLVLGILQNYSPFQLRHALDGEEIKPGRIYLGPPDHHVVVAPPGVIHLVTGTILEGGGPSANRLFKSAADFYGPRVIGILLSGDTEDGTRGLEAIERAGGVAIVQEPADASDPTMPTSAMRRDHPSYCVRADRIGTLVTQLTIGAAKR